MLTRSIGNGGTRVCGVRSRYLLLASDVSGKGHTAGLCHTALIPLLKGTLAASSKDSHSNASLF